MQTKLVGVSAHQPTLPFPTDPSPTTGGWPFSTAAHGWPIADCTAEGLKGVLALMDEACVRQTEQIIPDERCVRGLLGLVGFTK